MPYVPSFFRLHLILSKNYGSTSDGQVLQAPKVRTQEILDRNWAFLLLTISTFRPYEIQPPEQKLRGLAFFWRYLKSRRSQYISVIF